MYPGSSPAIVIILVAVGHDIRMWKSGEVAVRKVTWTVVYLWLMACDKAFSHQPMLNLVEICIVTMWSFFFFCILASSTNTLPPPSHHHHTDDNDNNVVPMEIMA